MDTMLELGEIAGALRKASNKSKRKGKWASISEIQRYTDEKVTHPKMKTLVRNGDAQKKGSLYRPTSGLAGTINSAVGTLIVGSPTSPGGGYVPPTGSGPTYLVR